MKHLADRIAPHLPRAQKVAGVSAVLFFLLGFLASIDVFLLPRGTPAAAWGWHPALLLLGALGGAAAAVRGRQIDRRRWELLDEPLLTDGERKLAHKEAERQRRVAATVFLLAPVFLGYWMAYQLAGEEGGSPLTYLLIAPPMLGFVAGLLVTGRALGPEETRF